tara:strand:- start:3 stop:689 length:687 start_codon:yes stop_codon:yes gene_type:complete
MSVVNFYEKMPTKFLDINPPNPNKDLHGFDIPFRLCVVAPSGSGKSNWITNLISLFSQGRGTFAQVFIICKDATEPLYKFLADKSDQIQVLEGLNNLPNLDNFDKEQASLVIIDDCQLDKNQERVCQYYIRGRKKGVSIAYLAQNYYVIPKVIRGNCSYLVMLKLSGDRELKMILRENGLGIDKDQLLAIYKYATSEKFSPLIVDIESTDDDKKFRKGFIEFLNPHEF